VQFLFPAVFLQLSSAGVTGLDAIRQIFQDDPNVTVAQDRSGMIRITIGSVSTAILQTKIQALTLSPDDQYSAPLAVGAVENTPEIRAAERSLGLSQPLTGIGPFEGAPIAGAPHLPKVMQNITVDEALDSVARIFKGIITYGICTKPDGKSLFKLNFIHGS
jgi:hypothetical protein